MGDPTVKVVVTADGSQAAREVTKAGAELTKLGVVSVTAGNLLANLGQRALSVGQDLARFPLDAALATGRYVEQLDNLTTQTGLSAAEQQAYDVVLNRSGLGLQDLSGIWRSLSQNVIAARDPLSDSAAKFRQLGIELNGSEGPNAVLQLVAERLAVLPDGFRKNTLAVELLGGSGARVLPAFKDGLAGAANEAKRLGTMLDSEARAKAAAFDRSTDDLSHAWQGLTHQIGVLAAPVLTDLTNNLTEATAKTSKWTAALAGAKQEAEGLVDTVRRMGPGATQFVPPPGLTGGGVRGTATPPTQAEMDALGLIEAQDQAARAATTAGERQEALGRAAVLRSQQAQFNKAHMTELQPGLASTFDIDQVQAREKVDESSRARPDLSGLNELQKGIVAIRDLMPELDANEALQLVTHNLEAGHAAVVAGVDDWQNYRDGLGDTAESARSLEAAQAELYQTEAGFIGAADAARRLSFDRIAAEEAQKRQAILDTFGESERGQEKLLDLELQSDTQRRAIIRQYPTFWEQQLQAIVDSNAFSLGSIVSTWSSGLATAVVQNKSFSETVKAAWQSTQIAILQAGLNTLVQWGAELGLSALHEIGLKTATEAATTAVVTAGAAAQTGAVVTGSAVSAGAVTAAAGTMAAANTTAAGISVSVWGGAATAILGLFGTIAGGFTILAVGLVTAVTAVGTFIMGVLSAIAAALTATVFGIPVALLIGAGIVGIVVALAATDNLPRLADGGIFTGAAVIAEAGTPEVAIPLDQRGKRFMNQLGFGGAGGEQRITVQVGDDVLVEKVLRGMPRMVHMRVGS